MKIVIAGGTGFLGRPLATALADSGFEIVLLSRRAARTASPFRVVAWTPDGRTGPWASELHGATAVVNLAGESIGDHRWSDAQKRKILESRVQATRSLVEAIKAATTPPLVLVSGSAVGYYGPCDDRPVTEDTPAGSDFLASVCVQWEDEAKRASASTRVVCVRTGLPMARDGGALPRMLPPFWFGAGGPIGSGRQYWPWIHRKDWIDLVRFAIVSPNVSGPLNATAPNPLPNAAFAKVLGRAIHRPALMPAPGFALKLLLGEMAEGLLLSGQRALPAKAERLGFSFAYPQLEGALAEVFSKRR
jgi:uncharacterized protein (TIGR01777 family)